MINNNNINPDSKVLLTSGDFISKHELLAKLIEGNVVFSYFKDNKEDYIYCDQVDFTNIDSVIENPNVRLSEGQNDMYGYHMIYHEYNSCRSNHKGKWLFCHRLVDDYNLKVGAYADLDNNPDRTVVHHIDHNKTNNNPDNLIRLTNKEHAEYHKDDLVDHMKRVNKVHGDKIRRQVCARHARTKKNREYGRLLNVAVRMHRDGYEITKDTYNSHKYEYSKRPATWERLIENFSDISGIVKSIESYYDDLDTMNNESKITVYTAGPFFNPTQVATIRGLETFLEDRGYNVFSPSRDGVKLVPNSSPEDRMRVFEDNVTHCNGSDLVIAVIDDRDSGTMVELGMRYSHWRTLKDQGVEPYASQDCPRIITFSNQGFDVNLMILGLTLCHCKGFEELGQFLDHIDEVGLENAKQSDSVHKLGFI